GSVAQQPAHLCAGAIRIYRRDRMARRQVDELDTSSREEGSLADKESVGPSARHRSEGGIDLRAAAGFVKLDLQPHGAGSRFDLTQKRLSDDRFGRIDKHGDPLRWLYQLVQQTQALRQQLIVKEINTGHVAARPREVINQPEPDWVFGNHEHNGGGDCGCRLGRCDRNGAAGCDYDGDAPTNQFGQQSLQPFHLVAGELGFDRDVFAIDKTFVLEPLPKYPPSLLTDIKRLRVEIADHRQHTLF